MKKRRNAIVAFLLCAVLCLAVGYASVTDTFKLYGSANAVAADDKPDTPDVEDVFDDEIYLVYKSNTCTNSDNSEENLPTVTVTMEDNDDTAKIEANGFNVKGDKVKVYFKVKNDHPDLSATVTAFVSSLLDTSSDYFRVTWGTENTTWSGENGTVTVAANGGESDQMWVEIEMIKTPIDNASANFTFTATATGVEAQG